MRTTWSDHAPLQTPLHALGLFDNVWPAPRPAKAESLSLGRRRAAERHTHDAAQT
jgi:hypothetical protein